MSEHVVEIRDLHFSFGDLEVLRGLSLDIPRGQVVAILGGSGSGKSTLLKLIGAQLCPQRGTVKVEGKDVHQLFVRGALQAAPRDGDDVPDLGPVHRPLGVREHRVPDPRELRSARGPGAAPGADEAARGRPARRARHDAGRPLGRHDAPRGARARHRHRPEAHDVRRALRRPRSDLAQPDRGAHPQPEPGARPHLDRGDLRRAGGAQGRRLHLRDRRRHDCRQGNAEEVSAPKIRISSSSSTRFPTARCASTSPGRHSRRTSASMVEDNLARQPARR